MRISLLSLFFIAFLNVFQAKGQFQLHIANDHFKDLRFQKAIKYYTAAIKRKPTLEATQRLADCYRFTKNYGKAEFWYEKATTYPGSPSINLYHYGQMLKCNQKYDQARIIFQKYASMPGADTEAANRLIASCDSAKMWLTQSPDFQLMNRADLNSTYSDFGTARLSDVAYVFTSNRPIRTSDPKLTKDQGTPYYKIVFSKLDTSGKATSIEAFPLSSGHEYHEATPVFSSKFDTVYFTQTRVTKQNKEKVNRLGIYYAVRKDNLWSEPRPFVYNNERYSVGHPSLSKDGSTLYFVSDVPGGKGGYDIYMCRWQNGGWSSPVNLGEVNSKEDEFYPVIKGRRLYFASEGYIGMGGMDVFYADMKESGFSAPVNLKTPFNSPQDDFAVYFDDTQETGFVSSNRPGGMGLDDIYSFNYTPPLPTKYYLSVNPYYMDGANKVRVESAEISVIRKSDEQPAPTAVYESKSYFVVEDGVEYVIKSRKNGFFATNNVVAIRDFKIEDTIEVSRTPRENIVLLSYGVNMEQMALNTSYVLNNIYYDFNKATLRPESMAELDKLVTLLNDNPGIIVQLGSYCDSRGSDTYNQILSQKRAQSVVDYLIKKGIKKNRLKAKGYGETRLVNGCTNGVPCTEEEHQLNRRTDFQILEIKE